MEPMAERLGVGHHRLASSSPRRRGSTRRCGRCGPMGWPLTRTPTSSTTPASPRTAARRPCGADVLRHPGQDRQLPDRGQHPDGHRQGVVAANWRLFCPASWDDTTMDDTGRRPRPNRSAVGGLTRHKAAGGGIRHRGEDGGPGAGHARPDDQRWGLPKRPVIAAQRRIRRRHRRSVSAWKNETTQYVVAVRTPPAPIRPSASRTPPAAAGRPSKPLYPRAPVNLRELALAHGQGRAGDLARRHQEKRTTPPPRWPS